MEPPVRPLRKITLIAALDTIPDAVMKVTLKQ
jgi:hypothetical protein